MPNLTRAGLTGGLAAAALAYAAGCAPDPVLPEPPPAPGSGWNLVNPRPFDIHVTDVWGPTPDRMFAVGLYGGLLVREGVRWRAAPAPTDTHLWDVHGCDWEHVYAVAADGLHFFDGKGWRREGPADLDELSRVFCLAPDDVMVVTGQRTSHHWDGRTWTRHAFDLEPDHDAGEWLAGAPDGSYLVTDGRQRCGWWTGDGWRFEENWGRYGIRSVAWSPGPPARWYAAGDDSRAWLATFRDGNWWAAETRLDGRFVDLAIGAVPHLVWRDDAGTVRVTNSEREDILLEGRPASLSFCAFPNGFVDNDFLVAAGAWGALLAGPAAAPTLPAGSRSVAFSALGFHVWPDGDFAAWDNRNGVLVSRAGVLAATDLDMGNGRIVGVWGPHPGLVYALGSYGDLYVLREGAAPEQLAAANEEIYTYTLAGRGDELWAGCWEGLARWDGQGWTVQDWPFAGSGISRLAVRADGGVWATSDGALGRWDGTSWHAEGPAGAVSYHDVVRDPATDDLLVIARVQAGRPRELLRLVDGQWQNLGHPGDPLSRLCPGPDGEVYATCYGGFQVWRDGTWSRLPPPGGRWSLVAGLTAGGDPAGGLYVSRLTGGIHHLDLGGLGIWR